MSNERREGGEQLTSAAGGGFKRGRRVGEDFGRDDFAEDNDGCGRSTSGSVLDTAATATMAAAAAANIGRAKHGKEAGTGSGGGGGDGKAELIRRRNCENARKARARKKMEVHQLQEQVEKLKQLHARRQVEARKAKELSARTEVLRRQTIRTFMKFRCENVQSYKQWAEIIDERFTMTLPITPYRWFNGQGVCNNSRLLRGIEDLMTDNGSLAVLVESLGCGTLPWRQEMEKGRGHGVELVCDIGPEDVLITNNTAMCSFTVRTTNAVKHGAKREWLYRGMLSAKFIPGLIKLVAVEHVFDVTSLMQQLQKVVGEEKEMPIVPNTPIGACQPSNEARVIMTATHPYTVVRCNESWTKLCGYSQEAIQGQTLEAIQGPRTDANILDALKRDTERGRAASSLLLNYKRDGTMFLNYLRVYPLIGDAAGTVTHFLGVLQEQTEPGEPDHLQSDAESPLDGKVEPQQMEAIPETDAPNHAATYVAAATGAAPVPKEEEEEVNSRTAANPWRSRRRVGFGVPCSSHASTWATPSTMSSASSACESGPLLCSSGGAGRGGGHGRSAGLVGAAGASSATAYSARKGSEVIRARRASIVKEELAGEGGCRGGAEVGTALLPERSQQQQRQQEQRQSKQEDVESDGNDEGREVREAAGCVGDIDEDESTQAFLAWADALAGSPEMEELESDVSARDATIAAAGGMSDGLGEHERIRSVSDSVVGMGMDGAWRLARLSGSSLDLSSLAGEPVDEGVRIRHTRQGEGELGRGSGGGRGVRHHHLERVAKREKSADRGVRSMSDSTAWGVPVGAYALPADSAAWDLLLHCGAVAPFLTGSGGDGLVAESMHGMQAGGAVGGESVRGEGGVSALPLDMDVGDLLLTQEELFGPAATGGGASNSSSNLTNMLDPTFLGEFPCGNFNSSGNCAGLGDTTADAAATSGIGILHHGSRASALPSLSLATMGRLSGGALAVVAESTSAASLQAKPARDADDARGGSSAGVSVTSSAMDLSVEWSNLAGCQIGGGWSMQGDGLVWRAAEAASTSRGAGGVALCGASVAGGAGPNMTSSFQNASINIGHASSDFSAAPSNLG